MSRVIVLVPNPRFKGHRTNSPAQRASVVDLVAWREDRRARALVPAPTRPGARPDRLGNALAWCQEFTRTGRNPFDPARLRG